jgi:MFS family permease
MTDPQPPAARPAAGLAALPRTVVVVGLVSLLMDTSSELIHSLLPVFLVGVLGASAAVVGLIEGIGEATAAIAKVFSGVLSDRAGRRKPLTAAGYGLAALSKPLFALASTPGLVLLARFIDRVGKGIRGAPRDALIADVTPPAARGAAYGLRQALDSVGAVLGPLLALLLMLLYAGDFRAVFWWAVVPGALAFLLVLFAVHEPPSAQPRPRPQANPLRLAELRHLSRAFWGTVAAGVVFTLARFSEAFLVLRADDAGLPPALLPLVMVGMNVVYAALAAPAGALSDRIGRRRLLLLAMGLLVAADVALALPAGGLIAVFIGVGLWGAHLAFSQGLLSALVADTGPADRRGTAFGVFNLATGVALLAASALAGVLWEAVGPSATFLAGAAFAIAAALLLTALPRPRPHIPA